MSLLSQIKSAIKNFRKRISWKLTLWVWLIIIATILFFVAFTIPFQQNIVLNRMDNEAEDITTSILHANSTSLITEEYGLVVDHCLNIVSESKSILYLKLVKNTGYTLLFTKDRWEQKNNNSFELDTTAIKGSIEHSRLIGRDVYKKIVSFDYSGLNWGWIEIGLSLDYYYQSRNEIVFRFTWLTIIMAIVGFISSSFFAKRLTEPIISLDKITKEIAEGNLSARTNIYTGDELESLATSFNKMSESLSVARDNLEAKVKERTALLVETNDMLINEVGERKKIEESLQKYTLRLEELQDIYRGIIAAKSAEEIAIETIKRLNNQISNFTSAYLVLINPDRKSAIALLFKNINDSTELDKDKLVIDNIDSYLHEYDEIINHNNLPFKLNLNQVEDRLLKAGQKSYVRSMLKIKDELIGELVISSSEKDNFTEEDIAILKEISNQLAVAFAQSRLQDNLKNQARVLQSSLLEKEVLLKEIHHRVKNNLQIITSLLNLQSRKINDEESRAVFRDSQSRIKSMALVHEKLYQSKEISMIDFSEYVKNLAEFIQYSYSNSQVKIDFNFVMEKVYFTIDTVIPLGLILNELISNIYKYAFNGSEFMNGRVNTVTIKSQKFDENLHLIEVSDNGSGIQNEINLDNLESLGLKLVHNLTLQLNGTLKIESNNGTRFSLLIPKNS